MNLRARRSSRRPAFDGLRIGPRLFDSSTALRADEDALFLSDLHFGDGAASDHFAGQDERLIDFLEGERRRVDVIVFLGDIFDMPQAWTTARVFAAHPELLAYLRALAREQRVLFISGNHDWSVDYQALFPGALCREAVLLGETALAWHGHQVDLLLNPGARSATAKTYLHSLLERLVGSRLVPPLERYDSPANRLALRLAVSWCRLTLTRARALRRLGQEERARRLEMPVRYLARSVHGDLADLFGATCRAVLGRSFLGRPCEAVLCGHSHLPGLVHTERGVYANTGTWTGGMRSYARWSEGRIRVLDADTGAEIGDQHYAGIPQQTEENDLFAWWARARLGAGEGAS